ncbi:MAG: hypothetical protein R3B74_15135 [Nitrospirales bacterium]|nr:hypothetical protein [Nitrospirales bacterium]
MKRSVLNLLTCSSGLQSGIVSSSSHSLHLEPATIALGGAALLLLLVTFPLDNEQAGHKVHELFGQVE